MKTVWRNNLSFASNKTKYQSSNPPFKATQGAGL
jgi:hypothetical protein